MLMFRFSMLGKVTFGISNWISVKKKQKYTSPTIGLLIFAIIDGISDIGLLISLGA